VKYFNGDYEEDSTSSGLKKYHYIHGGNGLTAIFVMEGSGNDTMYYVLSDHLGSLTTIVNETTSAVENYSFNAWGMPREFDDWTSVYTGELFAGRGFTGHEHLVEFNLINMNGRIYDPIVGRFLSPDPYVQLPEYPNSYNRYTYALNNPLIYTDPDGEFWHLIFGGLIGGTINLALNWNNADNFWQGLGYFGVGAAAGVATAAIGSAGGLAVLEAATFSGVAAGAITGGGNVAMQGGGLADILAGAIGGGLIGGSVGFLGGAAMMGLGGLASNISAPSGIQSVISDGVVKQHNINLLDVFNNLNYEASNFFSSNASKISGLGGGLGGVGAGNLFQFTSGSITPPKVNLQSNTIDGFVDWFSYLQQNRPEHYRQGIYYHVDDIVDHRTILSRHLSKGMYGESLSDIENSVQWNIADPHYRKRSHWNDNYVDVPIADNPYDGYFRIRLRLNRRTKISLTTNSYDLYIKMYDRIYGRRVY